MPVTDLIERTEILLQRTRDLLASAPNGDWEVAIFSGTSEFKLFEWLPDLVTRGYGRPCLAVMYGGSSYQNLPRRTAKIIVLILVENPQSEPGAITCRSVLDEVVAALDEQVDSKYLKWEIEADEAIDAWDQVEAIKATFRLRDH